MEAEASPAKPRKALEGLKADAEEARSRAMIVLIMLPASGGIKRRPTLPGRAAARAAALGGA